MPSHVNTVRMLFLVGLVMALLPAMACAGENGQSPIEPAPTPTQQTDAGPSFATRSANLRTRASAVPTRPTSRFRPTITIPRRENTPSSNLSTIVAKVPTRSATIPAIGATMEARRAEAEAGIATAIPRPTPTPRPMATPNPAADLSEMVKVARQSVVRIDTSDGSGTGVIFETQGRIGLIITSHHVVEGEAEVDVTVNDLSGYSGTVMGADPVRDLAVVRICCGDFTGLPFGDSASLQPGDEVVTIGYALGLPGEASVTRGIVSAIRYDSDYRSEVIQTDAAINPGNSGGPMLSVAGDILGINTFRIDDTASGRSAEGLGFAISAETVQDRLPALKTAQAAPTPTPTIRPTPTPSHRGGHGSGFGPTDGELWHDHSDDLISGLSSGVFASDVAVAATFVNPYSAASNPWDYGFIIRDRSRDPSSAFIQVLLTSDGTWNASWRQWDGAAGNLIDEGTLPGIDTRSGGRNEIAVFAFRSRGLLFINGEFASSLDLSYVQGVKFPSSLGPAQNQR